MGYDHAATHGNRADRTQQLHRRDCDRALADAKAAGATVTKPAADQPWGGYSGYFADLDGFPWEVAWNPGFTLREDGSVVLPE